MWALSGVTSARAGLFAYLSCLSSETMVEEKGRAAVAEMEEVGARELAL
jgi:hypothetical protein